MVARNDKAPALVGNARAGCCHLIGGIGSILPPGATARNLAATASRVPVAAEALIALAGVGGAA